MTDFTDEQKAAIRAAANNLRIDLTKTRLGDALVAALEKPVCPQCGSTRESICIMEVGPLPMVIEGAEEKLQISVPVERCQDCDFKWTDHRAEKIREQVMKIYYPDHPDLQDIEKPAPVFRDGEVYWCCSSDCRKIGGYYVWSTRQPQKSSLLRRRIRLSEMPQAVEDLRVEMEGFTGNPWPVEVRRAAREVLDAFDEQIEP